MLSNTRIIRVQWGDCDPAGIVYYPRYFEWFDASSFLLFEKATGMTKMRMLEKYNGAGLALAPPLRKIVWMTTHLCNRPGQDSGGARRGWGRMPAIAKV